MKKTLALTVSTIVLSTASCTGGFALGGPGNGTAGPSGTSGGNNQTGTSYTPPPGPGPGPVAQGSNAIFGSTLAEQKAVTEVEANLVTITELVRSKCGVPNLTITIAWTDYLPLQDSQFEGRTRDNVYGCADDQIDGPLRQLADNCERSSLTRGAMQQKVTSMLWHPRTGQVDAAHPSHVYNLSAGVLHVQYHVSSSNTDTTNLQKVL
jgi:hypothetical protein